MELLIFWVFFSLFVLSFFLAIKISDIIDKRDCKKKIERFREMSSIERIRVYFYDLNQLKSTELQNIYTEETNTCMTQQEKDFIKLIDKHMSIFHTEDHRNQVLHLLKLLSRPDAFPKSEIKPYNNWNSLSEEQKKSYFEKLSSELLLPFFLSVLLEIISNALQENNKISTFDINLPGDNDIPQGLTEEHKVDSLEVKHLVGEPNIELQNLKRDQRGSIIRERDPEIIEQKIQTETNRPFVLLK